MKVGPLLGMTIAVALIVAPMVAQQPPLLVIWNASQSVPVGLYLVTQASPHVGELAVLRLPPVIAAFAARWGYLPTSAYLLKPIAAVAGDLVCRFGERVLVRGVLAGIAEEADADGNAMPTWPGKVAAFCRWERYSCWPVTPGASTAATSVRSIPRRSRDARCSSGPTDLPSETLLVPLVGRAFPASDSSYVSDQDKRSPAMTPKSERALAARGRWLVARHLAESTPAGDILPKPDMMRRLRQAETERLAGDLSHRLNASYLPAEPGRQIAGIYEISVTTPTGKLAVVRRQDAFTLVPWRPGLEPFKGRAVMGMIGPNRVTWSLAT